jgi:two-component system, cell cycle sensor histidine kinase and response regulator CckA
MSATGLLDLSRALHRVRSLQEVMDQVRRACKEHTRYDRVYILLPAADRRSLEIVGYVAPNMDRVHRQVASIELDKDPFMLKVLALKEPVVIPDLRLDPLADQKQVEFFGNRTAIAIPMFDDDGVIGPFNVATFADQGVLIPSSAEMDFFVQVASLVGVVITRLRAEQAKEELEKQLISTQRLDALGRLAGEVAHDFNNLLLAVLGNAEMAAQELAGSSALSYLRDIRDATLRAATLSRQLLAFSRGQVISKRVFPLGPLVESSSQLLRRLLPQSITIDVLSSPQTGSISGDPGQIEQIVMNLVLNARDALPEGGRIVLETQNVRVDEEFVANHTSVSPGRYVLLTVSDNGHGMDMQTQRRIFEPFFTTKPAERGTGLGLSVVQGVVAQHDGHIHVYSEVGTGTTFKVYLPLAEQRALDIGAILPPPADIARGTEGVLVVDDEAHVRKTIEKVLSRAGYDVRTVASGQAATAECRQKVPDLLLTDIAMPDDNGLALAARLTEQFPGLRVLLMTGYAPARLQDVRWSHITKPFTPTELMIQIRGVLDRCAN